MPLHVPGTDTVLDPKTLPPGQACIACRKIKTKCDRVSPQCGRCVRVCRECIYEAPILGLEARVRELETEIAAFLPDYASDSLFVSHPVLTILRELPKRLKPPKILMFPTSSLSLALLSTGSTPDPYPSVPRHAVEEALLEWYPVQEMPFELIHTLVCMFLPFRGQFYFHMPINTLFRRLHLPSSDPRSIHPALLNAIFLCAVSVAGFSSFEHLFLKRTQDHLQKSLAIVDRPGDFLWASLIQGEWYCMEYRVLESHNAISSTLKMALAFGAYKDIPGNTSDHRSLLSREMDTEEHGNLAHALFLVDRGFEAGVGLPSSFPEGYLTDPRSWTQSSPFQSRKIRDHRLDLKVRAVSFKDGVMRFVLQSKDGLTDALWEEFESLRSALTEFQRSLPPVDDAGGLEIVETPELRFHAVTPSLLFVYMTMQANMILLYNVVATARQSFYRNVSEAAHGMANLVRLARGQENWLPLIYCDCYTSLQLWVAGHALVREMNENHPPSSLDQVIRLNTAHRDLNSLLDMTIDVSRRVPGWNSVLEALLLQLQGRTPNIPITIQL